jgi:hypothetical protein
MPLFSWFIQIPNTNNTKNKLSTTDKAHNTKSTQSTPTGKAIIDPDINKYSLSTARSTDTAQPENNPYQYINTNKVAQQTMWPLARVRPPLIVNFDKIAAREKH